MLAKLLATHSQSSHFTWEHRVWGSKQILGEKIISWTNVVFISFNFSVPENCLVILLKVQIWEPLSIPPLPSLTLRFKHAILADTSVLGICTLKVNLFLIVSALYH